MDFSGINNLDHELTLALNGSDSIFWDNVMYTVTNTFSWSLVIIMLFYIIFKNNNPKQSFLVILTMILMIALADRLCSGLVKPLVARWRPTQDPQLMYMVDVVRGYRGGMYGFFSGHSCNTFCMAVFLSLLFRDLRVCLTLFFWAASTTFTRIYLGVHYLGDITVGFLVGCIIGVMSYVIMNIVKVRIGIQGKRFVTNQFTSTGYLKSDMNLFLTVIFFNYLLIILISLFQGIN